MYKDESKYVYNEETAVEGIDYWFEKHPFSSDEKNMVRVHKASGGGTVIELGGPCGNLYLDRDGNA